MRVIVVTALLVLLTIPLAAQAQALKPGKYEVTFTSDLPALAGKPVKEEECLTQKDVDTGFTKLGVDPDNASCKVSDLKRAPGSVSYRITCTAGDRKSTGEASATHGTETFDLKIVNRTAQQPAPFTHRKVGKRVGECK